MQRLQPEVFRLYALSVRRYILWDTWQFPEIGLGLTLWDGLYEGVTTQWLRWCDLDGNVILTGAEQSAQREQEVSQERQRAEQEHQRADQERQRAERLAEQLRAMGIEPEI